MEAWPPADPAPREMGMRGRHYTLLLAAICWSVGASRVLGQADINPTGDPKLAPQRVLALDTGGHTGGVYRLVPNAYGDQLISVSYDKTIRIWDIRTGEPIRVLRPPIDLGAHRRSFRSSFASRRRPVGSRRLPGAHADLRSSDSLDLAGYAAKLCAC